MDFTRDPIIETIITPKDGYKLVVRNSKYLGKEEYLVDAVEVITFGQTAFFRSLERPTSFLLPIGDYELVETREARMVLKNVGIERSIKIGGGKETHHKNGRSAEKEVDSCVHAGPADDSDALEKPEKEKPEKEKLEKENLEKEKSEIVDKKKDRRRQSRKKRASQNNEKSDATSAEKTSNKELLADDGISSENEAVQELGYKPNASLLEPPATLISETINRYRESELFKGAFYLEEAEEYKPHERVQELLEDDAKSFAEHTETYVLAQEDRDSLATEENEQGCTEQCQQLPVAPHFEEAEENSSPVEEKVEDVEFDPAQDGLEANPAHTGTEERSESQTIEEENSEKEEDV